MTQNHGSKAERSRQPGCRKGRLKKAFWQTNQKAFLFVSPLNKYFESGEKPVGGKARGMGMKTVVLGIGNLLLGDEGVGVHAAQAFSEICPEEVEVRDIGTAILEAIPDFEKADKIIVIDAMKAHGTPGTIYRIPLGECLSNDVIGSLHGFDLKRVLALAGREQPPEVLVFGVEPAHVGWSLELSEVVKDALPELLIAVENEIKLNENEEKARI